MALRACRIQTGGMCAAVLQAVEHFLDKRLMVQLRHAYVDRQAQVRQFRACLPAGQALAGLLQ